MLGSCEATVVDVEGGADEGGVVDWFELDSAECKRPSSALWDGSSRLSTEAGSTPICLARRPTSARSREISSRAWASSSSDPVELRGRRRRCQPL